MKNLLDGYDLAEQQGIKVLSHDIAGLEAASVVAKNGKCGIAIDPFLLISTQDEKMKLYHELGHCLTGSFYYADSPQVVKGKCEARAWSWAFKQLVPYDELMAAVHDGYTETWELAECFDVPEWMVVKAISYYQDGNR